MQVTTLGTRDENSRIFANSVDLDEQPHLDLPCLLSSI